MKNTLVRYNAGLPSLFDRDEFLTPFSSFFDDYFNSSFPSIDFGENFFDKGTYPKVDVINDVNSVTIEAEVPGLTKEQVTVELDNNILKIKGQKQDAVDNKNKTYVHRELKKSSFCRSFSLNENLDSSKLEASFENGILKIVLPKITPDIKKQEVRKIEIK